MFEEVFPQYMVMGMTEEEYWDKPPRLAVAYRKAHRLRRQTENEQAWLQGLYVYDAFATCLANAFAKRGAKKQTYLERPVDIFPLSESEKRIREQEEFAKMQKAMEALQSRQKRVRKQKDD